MLNSRSLSIPVDYPNLALLRLLRLRYTARFRWSSLLLFADSMADPRSPAFRPIAPACARSSLRFVQGRTTSPDYIVTIFTSIRRGRMAWIEAKDRFPRCPDLSGAGNRAPKPSVWLTLVVISATLQASSRRSRTNQPFSKSSVVQGRTESGIILWSRGRRTLINLGLRTFLIRLTLSRWTNRSTGESGNTIAPKTPLFLETRRFENGSIARAMRNNTSLE